MNVLFEDNEIIVLVKPVGVPSEDTPNGEKGILDLLKNQQGLKDVFLLHRLDRNVGGVMVFSKTKKVPLISQSRYKRTLLRKHTLQL